MSQSNNFQFVHFVWSTKNLLPLINKESQNLLFAYIAGVLKKFGGFLIASSGTENHIHLLMNVPLDRSIADLVCRIKSSSSKWYRNKNHQHSAFNWNDGYSAFTVSPSSINSVKKYLDFEENRHMTASFEDELLNFLKIQEIGVNPIYLTSTTYSKIYIHLVWSVKNREPLIKNFLEKPLYDCIKFHVEKNHCQLYAIGNVSDHIHILIECSKKISISSLVQNLKTSTTCLIKFHDKANSHFSWQNGFGAFSVSKTDLKVVSNYVNNQKKHHAAINSFNSFEEELNYLRKIKK